jgi:hypothetical protein
MIGESRQAMVVRAELGIQQGLYSTLNSYLEKLLYLITGNFGKRGTQCLAQLAAALVGQWTRPALRTARYRSDRRPAVPPNVLADAIESDHIPSTCARCGWTAATRSTPPPTRNA